ncbi:MAG: hypothetical protein IK016_11110 [Lachnospiraceae bacterium]|nr:hypothetical protein [Lachnospiraceae bacterium]
MTAKAATIRRATGSITYNSDKASASDVYVNGDAGDSFEVYYQLSGSKSASVSQWEAVPGAQTGGVTNVGYRYNTRRTPASNNTEIMSGFMTVYGTIQSTGRETVEINIGGTRIGTIHINAAGATPTPYIPPVPPAPAEEKEPEPQRVSVHPAEFSFLYGQPESITYSFESLLKGFGGLEAIQVPTEEDKATGKKLWIGPAHQMIDGKNVTIGMTATGLLKPGRHLVRFSLGNHRYAEAYINVLTEENFDANDYATRYEDVRNVYGENRQMLWLHYTLCGRVEKRNVRVK